MNRQAKTRLIAYLSAFSLFSLLLSVSLSNFIPQPGIPLSDIVSNQWEEQEGDESEKMKISELFLQITLSLLFLTVLFFMIRKIRRNKLGRGLLSQFFLAMGIALTIAVAFLFIPYESPPLPSGGEMPAPLVKKDTPPAVDSEPSRRVLMILLWTVGIILFAMTAAVILILTASEDKEEDVLDRISREAALTRESIETGGDFRESIIRCYRNMCLILLEEQGVERQSFMTVGDFEKTLEKTGIGGSAVHRLSGLFEAVRYGKGEPTEEEEKRAILYLGEIGDAVGQLKRGDGDEKK